MSSHWAFTRSRSHRSAGLALGFLHPSTSHIPSWRTSVLSPSFKKDERQLAPQAEVDGLAGMLPLASNDTSAYCGDYESRSRDCME